MVDELTRLTRQAQFIHIHNAAHLTLMFQGNINGLERIYKSSERIKKTKRQYMMHRA